MFIPLGTYSTSALCDLLPIIMLFQLMDLEAKIVVCIPSTYHSVARAVQEVQENSDQKIMLFSFGEAEGCINMLDRVNELDESNALAPIKFTKEEMENHCAIVFWNDLSHALRPGLCSTRYTARLHVNGAWANGTQQDYM